MYQQLSDWRKAHKRLVRWLLVGGIATASLPFLAMLVGYLWIHPYQKYVLDAHDTQLVATKNVRVGLVMGAGVTKHGKPFRELQARLDVAAQAYRAHQVQKLILTGDNRFKNYDEPTAMVNYLVDVQHLPRSALQPDFAGRDTYASCERAAKVFGLHKTIIFSANSHLPRAIYLCRNFGIEAYGIGSHAEANNAQRRELLARVKAICNVLGFHAPTILGDPISV